MPSFLQAAAAMSVRCVGQFAAASVMSVFCATVGAAPALESVSVRLDWVPGADHALLFVAKDRGYYAAQGLDVTLNNGQGSSSTLQVVGTGNEDIGIAGMAAIATAIGRGLPVIAIAGTVQRSPDSIISLKGTPIKTVQDLVGKRMGIVPGDESAQMFPAFGAVNKIDVSTIHKTNMSAGAAYTSLLNGDVDFICGWVFADAVKIARMKPINPPILYVDSGLNILGSSLFVTRKTATSRAEMLKRFMVATQHAADDIAANPQIGPDTMARIKPEYDRQLLTDENKIFVTLTHTANSAGHPFGWVSPLDLADLLSVMQRFYDLPKSVTADALFTDAFTK